MKIQKNLVVFNLDNQRFALSLHTVEKVVRVVEITSLPKAPDYIKGIIDFHGEIIPVVNVRMLFNLPERKIELSDLLIITKTSMRKVALWVDSISEVVERTEDEIIKSEKILLGIDYVEGVFKFKDGMVLLQDLDQFLSMEEVKLLRNALKKQNDKVKKEEYIKKSKAKITVDKNKLKTSTKIDK